MPKPLISVIVPVYNVVAYLPLLLDGLARQTFTDFEVIFVNDGSTDDSATLLASAVANESRYRLVHKRNGGLSDARNHGLGHAQGEWIVFLDSDDCLLPDALSRWLENAERHKAQVAIGNAIRFHAELSDASPDLLLRDQPFDQCLSGRSWIKQAVAAGTWKHYVWLQMLRRDFIESAALRFDLGMIHEDILWTTRMALAAERLVCFNDAVYAYRINAASLTGSVDPVKVLGRARSYSVIIQTLLAIARQPENTEVASALRRHAVVEAGHLMGVARKRLQTTPEVSQWANGVLKSGVVRELRRHASGPSQWWSVVRLKRALERLVAAG